MDKDTRVPPQHRVCVCAVATIRHLLLWTRSAHLVTGQGVAGSRVVFLATEAAQAELSTSAHLHRSRKNMNSP